MIKWIYILKDFSCCKSGSFNTNLLRIAKAWISICCVCIQIIVGLSKIEIERQKKQSHKKHKDLRGSAYAYIHGWCQAKPSLTKEEDYNSSTLTEPKSQVHQRAISHKE